MKTFKTSRDFPVSPETIYASFLSPVSLAKWWGPSGFTNTFKQFQFKTGGKWSFVMHGPDGRNYPNEAEFMDIVPNEKIVIRHLSEPHFTLSILISKSTIGTTIQWIQEFDSEDVANKIAHIIEPSNEQNLDRLAGEVCGH